MALKFENVTKYKYGVELRSRKESYSTSREQEYEEGVALILGKRVWATDVAVEVMVGATPTPTPNIALPFFCYECCLVVCFGMYALSIITQ